MLFLSFNIVSINIKKKKNSDFVKSIKKEGRFLPPLIYLRITSD